MSKKTPQGNREKLNQLSNEELTELLVNWLHSSLTLAESFYLDQIITELRSLETRLSLPDFRLAVIGEFQRGKSFLLNRLLERDILPEGAVPTTATLTSIVAGSEEGMEVNLGEGNCELRPLVKESWQDLLATAPSGNAQEVFADKVRVTLNNTWLRGLDVELVDTPGAGDFTTRRAGLVFDLLSQCDATVLVVSAICPFSLTEQSFLEEEVMGRHVPRILVVVSMLDKITEIEHRLSLLERIRHRIEQISSNIPVLPTFAVDKNNTDEEVLAAVRTQIETIVECRSRQIWRSHQVAAQLADWLGQMIEIGKGALVAKQMNIAEREKARRQVQEVLQDAEWQWEQLRIELEQRRLKHERKLLQTITAHKDELIGTLIYELEQAQEPVIWWQQQLPFLLRKKFAFVHRKLKNYLIEAFEQDFEWLQKNVSSHFNTSISEEAEPDLVTADFQQIFKEILLVNTQRERRFFRFLNTLTAFVALLRSNAIAAVTQFTITIGIWMSADKLLSQKVETQRRILLQKLQKNFDQIVDNYRMNVIEHLRQLYHQFVEETKQKQQAWQSAKFGVLQANESDLDRRDWQDLINRASSLKEEICAVLDLD